MRNDGTAPYEERNTTDLTQPKNIENAGASGRYRPGAPNSVGEPGIVGTSDNGEGGPAGDEPKERMNVANLRDMGYATEYETEPRDPSMGVRPWVTPNPVTRPNTPLLSGSLLQQQKVNPFQVEPGNQYPAEQVEYFGPRNYAKGYTPMGLSKSDTGAKRP